MSTARSSSIDFVKTVIIFGVCYIHSSFLLSSDLYLGPLFSQLFRIGVPIFIVFWAYFFEKGIQKRESEWAFVLSKFKHTLIVFFLWSLMYFLVLWDPVSESSLASIISKHWLGYGWSGQYFFIILFQFFFLFPLIRRLPLNKTVLFLIILFGVVCYVCVTYLFSEVDLIHKVGKRIFIYWMPYVYTGVFLARYRINFSLLWASLLIAILIVGEYLILDQLQLNYMPYMVPSILVSSLVITVAVLSDIKMKLENRVSKITEYIGANTMTIFVANPLIIIVLDPVTRPIRALGWPPFVGIILSFISAGLVMSLCLVLAYIINKTKLKGVVN